MKYEIFTIFAILFIIISISTVSAENSTNQMITGNDESIDIMYINNTYKDMNIETNDGTFSEFQSTLYKSSSGDTILLNKSYSYDESFKTGGMTINKEITIDGNGKTLDGKNTSRIFYIDGANAKKVILKNIKFVNAYSSGAGGAILDDGAEITLNNCTFINNKIDGNTGGAIAINRANNVVIVNSEFNGNSAKSIGGAIVIVGNNTTISNNIFTKNEVAINLGGAIITLGHDNTIKNNTFIDNFAGRDGGAVEMEGTVTGSRGERNIVTDNIFINNTATFGGAVGLNALNCTISNNIFSNNNAIDSQTERFGGLGGAIRVMGEKNTKIINNTFINNTAYRQGGAIYIEDNNSTIIKNILTDNHAEIDGGGSINIKGDDFTISDNKISLTSSPNSGGAVFCKGNNTQITGNLITKALSKENGGAIHLQGINITVINNNLTDNEASILGGAIFLKGAKAIIDSNYLNNNTCRDGGAAYLESVSAKITNNQFKDNTANSRAGALFMRNDNATVNNNHFENNTSKNTGGALYMESNNAIASNNYFVSNKAGDNQVGGAIRWIGDNGTIKQNKFQNNIANNGFGIYGKGNNPQITENIFINGMSTDGTLKWDGITQFNDNNFTEDQSNKKTVTTLSVPDKSYDILASNKTLSATLKDFNQNPLSGKKLTFIVNGESYIEYTHSNGIATITLNLKTVNSYPVTVIYDGDSTTEATKIDSAKITITKVKTTAKFTKKTFKKSVKSKKVSFTLKTSYGKPLKNKKITFKVKSKNYSAKTNKKGVATVNLKLTKKGTYKLIGKFKGDKTYYSITKTIKIKIK